MNEYGNDFVVLTDEDGNEVELEHIDTLEHSGETYMAFIPTGTTVDEPADLYILKVVPGENDEEMLVTIEDEDELREVYSIFSERLEEYFELDEDDFSDEDDEEDEEKE